MPTEADLAFLANDIVCKIKHLITDEEQIPKYFHVINNTLKDRLDYEPEVVNADEDELVPDEVLAYLLIHGVLPEGDEAETTV